MSTCTILSEYVYSTVIGRYYLPSVLSTACLGFFILLVVGRVLPDAKLQYASSTCIDAANSGQWRTPPTTTLFQPSKLHRWAVLNLAGLVYSSASVVEFLTELVSQLQKQGGSAAVPEVLDGSKYRDVHEAVQAAAAAALNTADLAARARSPVQLLLVVLSSGWASSKQYSEVKAAAADLCIPSQCMVASRAGIGSQIKPSYVANLLLKVTAKSGGIGWELPQGPAVWAPPLAAGGGVMVFGVDVGHGIAGGSGSKPSVAGVVGSLNASCSRYGAVALEQTAGHEIVLGMREAAARLLKDRQTATGMLPASLLVYRDGVSDSQYLAVLQQEVTALRQACAEVAGPNYKPKVWVVL